MNKTIIININGTVFHIEEDAYEILKNYMTAVKRHFFDSDDSLEITTDIENRIAELFTEILTRENKQVIAEQDVISVIAQMGRVEDFNTEAEEPTVGPASQYEAHVGPRRLFRDPDDHLIAGVCAGIANYFDVQPAWVRLAFAVAIAFGGTGLILYVILWIVVPRAITRADRMSMKGEKLDLQGFKRNFEAEVHTLGTRLNNFHQEAQPLVYKTRDFMGDFFYHFGRFLSNAAKVFLKIVAIMFLIGATGALVALIIALVTFLAYGNTNIYHLFPFNIVNYQYNNIFLTCGFLLLVIPLVAIILIAVRLIFERAAVGRSVGSTLVILWIAAVSVVIYYALKATAEFRSYASFSQNANLKPLKGRTLYLKLNDVKYLTREDSTRLDLKRNFAGKVILNSDEDDEFNSPENNVTIYIEKADTDQPTLTEEFSSRGRDYTQALMNARNTSYHFIQQDSVLKFDRKLHLEDRDLWRDQEVHIHLKIPANTKLVIDDDMDRFLRGASVYECKETNKTPDAKSAIFMMTTAGIQCSVDTIHVTQQDTTKTNQ